MQTLAILCESTIDPRKIIEKIGSIPSFNTEIFNNVLLLIGEINEGRIDGLVFAVREFTAEKVKFLDIIKKRMKTFPVILTSKSLDDEVRTIADSYDRFTVIKYPEELDSLPGVFSKIFKDEKVIVRKTLRYDVQLPAKISYNGLEFKCQLSNLSRGGAQVEVEDAAFEEAQNLVLFVPLFNDLKRHNVAARIIWTRTVDGKTILGLEFISPDIPVFQ